MRPFAAVLAPELVDQPVGGDDASRVEQEQREQRALLRAAELQRSRLRWSPRAGRASGSPDRQSRGSPCPFQEDPARVVFLVNDAVFGAPLANRWQAVTGRFGPGRTVAAWLPTPTSQFAAHGAASFARSSRSSSSRPPSQSQHVSPSHSRARSPPAQDRPGDRTWLAAHPVSGQGYGYPVKPFDREHLIRATSATRGCSFTGRRPWTRSCTRSGSFSFHQGVDISAPGGTAVYPVVDEPLDLPASTEWIRVTSGNPRAFEYWDFCSLVQEGRSGHRSAHASRPRHEDRRITCT